MLERPVRPISDWFRAQERFVLDKYDNITLATGEEGNGKSNTILQFAKRLNPKMPIENVHFDQRPFLDQIRTLSPGDVIVLDEFRGHRRASMRGDRLEFLDMLKEIRGLHLHVFIGFPHVVQLDRDILRSRIRNWLHHPCKGRVIIRERQSSVIVPNGGGDPEVIVKWPVFGGGPYKVAPNTGKFQQAYDARKEAHMRRRRELDEEATSSAPAASSWDVARDILEAIKQQAGPPPAPVPRAFGSADMKLLDQVQAELARSP